MKKRGMALILAGILCLSAGCGSGSLQVEQETSEPVVEPLKPEVGNELRTEDGKSAEAPGDERNLSHAPEPGTNMFMKDDRLYVDTGEKNSMVRCGNLDFNLDPKDHIDEESVPAKNGQWNFRPNPSYAEGFYGGQYSFRENHLEIPMEDGWHIFAYHENDLDGLTMRVIENTDSGLTLEFDNKRKASDGEVMDFGEDYTLEKWDKSSGEWRPAQILLTDEWGWNDIAWMLPHGEKTTWKTDFTWLYGKLEKGTYRIAKKILVVTQGDCESHWYTAEFAVK